MTPDTTGTGEPAGLSPQQFQRVFRASGSRSSIGAESGFSRPPACENLDGERSSTVYVHSFANQVPQPNVYKSMKLTGEDPEIVAEWEVKEFVWFSKFLRELPEVYELLLNRLDVDPEDYSSEVGGFYRYYHRHDKNRKCDVGSIYVPVVRAGRYHPYTSVKHRRRASSQALDRLEFLEKECRKRRVKFDYLLKIDLTLPKVVSELWDSERTQRHVNDAVKDFLELLHEELFGGHGSQFGVICNHHYWATRTPLEPHRHVHLTIPNVVYNSKTDMFHRIRPWIEKRVIKDCWQRALKKNALWVGVPDHVRPDTWIGYIKFGDRNKVIHRLSYCCRKPIEDLVTNLTRQDLDNFNEDFAWFLLGYTPRRINLGFLTNLKRFGYSRKSNFLKCPICGGDMIPERDRFGHVRLYDRPPPDVPSLYRSRQGEWRCLANRG